MTRKKKCEEEGKTDKKKKVRLCKFGILYKTIFCAFFVFTPEGTARSKKKREEAVVIFFSVTLLHGKELRGSTCPRTSS